MPFTFSATNTLGETGTVQWADEVHYGIIQLAADLYKVPANAGDGSAQLTYPLQHTAAVYSSHATSAGTAGVTINFPLNGYTPASSTDYEVQATWREDPKGNGAPFAICASASFTLCHYGEEAGKQISYTVFRKTA